jgi:AcrR family transcriptional regulator
MPRTTAPRTRAETAADTRRRVLDAAEAVFRREGFHGASLDQVAREAGFTKGAVYSRFDSKADLFFALLDRRSGERVAGLEASAFDDLGAEEFVRAFAEAFARSVRDEPDWWAVVIEFMSVVARDPALRERYAAHHDRTREAIAADLERRAPGAGRAPALPARHLATAMLAIANGLTLERLIAPSEVDDALYAETQAAILHHATRSPR